MNRGNAILIRKLESGGTLSSETKGEIAKLPMREQTLDPDQVALRQGERPKNCCLLIDGFMYRHFILPDGKRQILSIHTPGEIPDLQSLHLVQMDHSLAALDRCEVAFIPHVSIHRAIEARPELANIFWRETLIDAAIFRQWIVNLGRRTAEQRLAHIICELFVRLTVVDKVKDNTCRLPLSQIEIADSLGLSMVHVNRTLQRLRIEGGISFHGDRLVILDWERLAAIAEFDSTYLWAVKPNS